MTADSLHVYPLGDLIEHEVSETCACLPTVEPVERDDGSYGWIHKHHSLDGREKRERMRAGLAELMKTSPEQEPSADEIEQRTQRARQERGRG